MKRPPPSADCESSTGSKRRRRASTSDDDDCSRGQHTPAKGFGKAPPLHKIYNSTCRKEKPDELFRKDLISAMKLPDNEQLDESEFWDVTDTWKQEWERGVQVPVNSKNVPNPEVRILRERSKTVLFKQPKKLMRTTEDDFFTAEHHVLIDTAAKAEKICKYDMDDLDSQWLILFNEYREDGGKPPIKEDTMEIVLEDFELQCSNGFQDALKTEKGLGIEYDENVVCEVCRARENEDGNEMVFCDICNICVHQACYGIMAIPEGSWVCRPCALNIKPPCVLCPNSGGAMKCTSSGEKWAHVSCALWIPEVSIGCPEKMEPILRISQIPTSRWALICSLCRERVGACIQCSVKQCKVAYHVTCAIENGLEMEMKSTRIDSSEEGVKMQSFCSKHSKTETSREKSSAFKSPRKRKKKKEMNSDKDPEDEVDEHNARLQKIRSLEAEFFNYVNIKETVEVTKVDFDVAKFLYYYWLQKRKAKFNKPLLITKCDEANLLIKQHENLLYSRLKMFVHLRQDLERVRNLCYMISRREKIFRSYLRVKSDVFEKQVEVLNEDYNKLTSKDIMEVIKCRAGDNLYDKFYCIPFEEDEKEEIPEKESAPKLPNPYSKSYPNNIHTRSRRHTTTQSFADNYDTDSRDMPVLVKCKSEENVSTVGSETNKQPILTHSPFVIKIESNVNNKEQEAIIKLVPESNSDSPSISQTISDKIKSPVSKEHFADIESNDHDTLKGSFENINVKTKKPAAVSETSNDKNSLCLSDKENISAQKPIKIKKTRSQSDSKHSDFKNSILDITSSKSELFVDENSQAEVDVTESKKNSKLDKRSTRYQMRTRCHSSEIIQENDETYVKSADTVETLHSHPDINDSMSPSNHIDGPTFKTVGIEKTLTDNKISPQTQKRKRGRPRKIPYEVSPDENLSVIKNEMANEDDQTNLCSDILGLTDSNQSSFRMSLRNGREHPVVKSRRGRRRRKKRSAIIKLEHPDAASLKEANLSVASESTDLENEGKSSPDWDAEDARPPRLTSAEPPASTRIIIRLRKDPNRESWKNDSSSSSDVPAAFHIVRNDLDGNSEGSVSEFPSRINGGDSPENQAYSFRDESENKHRYSMRERTGLTSGNIKCTFSRS